MFSQINVRLSAWKTRRFIWMPLLAFVITRLGIASIAYFSTPIMADSTIPPYHLHPENTILDVFGSRWDTGFYLSIANDGYRFEGERLPSVAFFPLLPILMRAVASFTGNTLLAGLLIANVALLGAAIFQYLLVEGEFGMATAERSIWYLLIYPASFFGSAIYTESLFLFLSILAIYLARKKRWLGAGMVGILASLTRFVGVILGPVLLVEWLQSSYLPDREEKSLLQIVKSSWSGIAAAVLAPAGALVYMLYLKLNFNDALAFLHASASWGRSPTFLVETISSLFAMPVQGWRSAILAGALPLDDLLDLGFVSVFLILGIILLLRRRWSEGLYVFGGALISLSSGLLMSQRRYMWVLFPAFVLLAIWGENAWIDRLIFFFSILALGLFTAMFGNWYWVG